MLEPCASRGQDSGAAGAHRFFWVSKCAGIRTSAIEGAAGFSRQQSAGQLDLDVVLADLSPKRRAVHTQFTGRLGFVSVVSHERLADDGFERSVAELCR